MRISCNNAMPDDDWEKFKNKMLAHLDGIYVFSAREDCDMLVTVLIQLFISAEAQVQLEKKRRRHKWRVINPFTW